MIRYAYSLLHQSLPVRERGLKYFLSCFIRRKRRVAPRAGAWIEISPIIDYTRIVTSLPVRERGLKFNYKGRDSWGRPVAPRAGAWIEINT